MIAAIYARKSTEQHGVADEQKSVARQIEHARTYAARKGWAVAPEHIYVDDGISGAEFATRPGFVRLMNSLKPRPQFQVLVMSEESRLGREQIEVSYALKQLVTAGVRVFSYLTDSERTLDSPIEKAMLALSAMADEMEREKARQRTYDAMVRKAREGHHVGGDCFGYRSREVLTADGRRSHVVREVYEPEAKVVRRIFALTAEGYGKTRIAHLLNSERAPSPRPRQGRPKAWAPSTVGSVLHRDLYRGVMVWNKRKKRDRWGGVKPTKKAPSEWLSVEVPELAIVTAAQWQAAHERLAATRANYLRATDGKLWGRPQAGTAAKYLLTGHSRCGICGGSLELRTRAVTGKRRASFYSCSSHYRRGPSVCPNKIEIPMLAADAAVVDAMLTEVLNPDRLAVVAQRAIQIAHAEREGATDLKDELERELAHCKAALGRLTAAVAAGGDVPALVDAIREHDGRRCAIEQRLAAFAAPPPKFDASTEQRLRAAAAEWQDVLGRQVPLARQIVGKLFAERITFTPEEQDGQPGFRFQAVGTVEKLIAGSVPGGIVGALACLPTDIPPTGFEPVLPP